ncbi:MAG: HEPN domain-containing protein [Spirochaetaceae bacterium]|jgi:HEPN domain-containing protein|nr:HEPN domain-containing protein [Spirochaetaceae bacterium]
MDRNEEIRQWLHLAEEDLSIAENCANYMHPTPDERICNLCQAVVERYLKVFLLVNNVIFKYNHDIVTLWKQCEAIMPEFNRFASHITILADYAVFPRYPNELQLSESDMRLALQYAKDIRAFVEPLVKGGN